MAVPRIKKKPDRHASVVRPLGVLMSVVIMITMSGPKPMASRWAGCHGFMLRLMYHSRNSK